jgi:hypothetical protein
MYLSNTLFCPYSVLPSTHTVRARETLEMTTAITVPMVASIKRFSKRKERVLFALSYPIVRPIDIF